MLSYVVIDKSVYVYVCMYMHTCPQTLHYQTITGWLEALELIKHMFLKGPNAFVITLVTPIYKS